MDNLYAQLLGTDPVYYGQVQQNVLTNDPMHDAAVDVTWDYALPLFGFIKAISPFKSATRKFLTKKPLTNVNDGIKRTLYTKKQVGDYYKDLLNKHNYSVDGSMFNYSDLSKEDIKGLRQKWRSYAKSNLIGNSYDIPEYTTIKFTNKNLGEDYPHNMPNYPGLAEQLLGSKYVFSTNYKGETDRLYDHLINPNDKLKDYLIEVIQEPAGTLHHNYKMMKDLKFGDKP